jgi:pyruvate kinase
MMLNQSSLTVESKSAERTLITSHSPNLIPAAWQTPLPARTAAITESINSETKTTPPASKQPEKDPLHISSRKTKIIATLGSATDSGDVLRSLLETGVSVFRLNLACISREAALKSVYAVRSISTELQRPVSLLLDIQSSPALKADSPAISESDWADLHFGLECGVDWLAVSAGHDGDAVRQLRQFLVEQKRSNIGILAIIKNPTLHTMLDQVIQDADGIILNGGNPADECPDRKVSNTWPLVRQQIMQNCICTRKLVVVVTGENLDMASALFSKPDALLLTEENSSSPHLLHNVLTLDALIRHEESNDCREVSRTVPLMSEQDQVVAVAVQQASETKAEGIVVLTRTGNSPALCAALRPRQSRVIIFTPDARLARRLRLHYALETVVLPFSEKPDANMRAAEKVLLERKLLVPGSKFVFITDPLNQSTSTQDFKK